MGGKVFWGCVGWVGGGQDIPNATLGQPGESPALIEAIFSICHTAALGANCEVATAGVSLRAATLGSLNFRCCSIWKHSEP